MNQSITPPLRPPQIELTTRDHLAFDILKALLSSGIARPNLFPEQYAEDSYALVDVMLKVRNK